MPAIHPISPHTTSLGKSLSREGNPRILVQQLKMQLKFCNSFIATALSDAFMQENTNLEI